MQRLPHIGPRDVSDRVVAYARARYIADSLRYQFAGLLYGSPGLIDGTGLNPGAPRAAPHAEGVHYLFNRGKLRRRAKIGWSNVSRRAYKIRDRIYETVY